MAIAWCAHVKPSEGIFPKLPVYLRLHHAAYERNVRVRNAVIAAADARAVLEQLNRATLPAALILPAARSAPPPPVALLAQPAPAAACGAAAATEAAGALARAAPRLPLAPPLAQPIQAFARPTTDYSLAAAPRPLAMIGGPQWSGSHSYGTVTLLSHAPAAMRASAVPLLVGDRLVGGQLHAAGERQQQQSNETRAVGQRGQDVRRRNPRTCKSCKQSKDTCVGALRGAEFCQNAPLLPRGG
jgi:hypothetical protein